VTESSRCSFYKRRESCLGTALSAALAAASARALEGEDVREIESSSQCMLYSSKSSY
jgi:hypothetical protein